MANKIGEKQFHIMCNMWGVDEAIKAVKRMSMNLERMAVMLTDISNEAKAEYALQEEERKNGES